MRCSKAVDQIKFDLITLRELPHEYQDLCRNPARSVPMEDFSEHQMAACVSFLKERSGN